MRCADDQIRPARPSIAAAGGCKFILLATIEIPCFSRILGKVDSRYVRGLNRVGDLKWGRPMTTEQMLRRPADQSMTPGASLADADDWTLVNELQSENQRLRELVIYLSDIVIKNVVGRKWQHRPRAPSDAPLP